METKRFPVTYLLECEGGSYNRIIESKDRYIAKLETENSRLWKEIIQSRAMIYKQSLTVKVHVFKQEG